MVGKIFSWKGFEFIPSGCLLEQVVDLSGDMGFAYERSTKYYKDFHTHDRLMLIFPRGTSSMDVRTKNPHQTFTVNYKNVLYVPKGLVHDDEGTSSIYDTMAFYPSPELIESAAKKVGITTEDIKKLTTECNSVERSERLDQLVQDYFFERVVSRESVDQEALLFLGRRIMEEALSVTFLKDVKGEALPPDALSEESITSRALRYIEANLFEPLDVPDIAKRSHASASTLLRRFKSDVGMTPYMYIKNRRLEEALLLLKTGSHPVGDVALLVGYENFGSFSEAFKEKYGEPPSHFKKN
jgi:AraC-like DNA-binding protein